MDHGAAVPLARNSATGAALGGLFYLAGGRRVGEGNSAQLDAYDPKTDTWTTLRPMPRAAGGLAGAALNGKLYVFGGEGGPGVIANCWSYDPATDQWTAEPDMATPPPRPGRRSGEGADLRHRRRGQGIRRPGQRQGRGPDAGLGLLHELGAQNEALDALVAAVDLLRRRRSGGWTG